MWVRAYRTRSELVLLWVWGYLWWHRLTAAWVLVNAPACWCCCWNWWGVACKSVPRGMGEMKVLFIVSLYQRQKSVRGYRVCEGTVSVTAGSSLGGGCFPSPLTLINSLVNFSRTVSRDLRLLVQEWSYFAVKLYQSSEKPNVDPNKRKEGWAYGCGNELDSAAAFFDGLVTVEII